MPFKSSRCSTRRNASGLCLLTANDELMGNYGFETKARLAFLLGGENDVIFVVFQAFNKIERETLRYAELYRFTEIVVGRHE